MADLKLLLVFLVLTITILNVQSQRFRPPIVAIDPYDNNVNIVPRASGACPESNGRYPTSQCDGYIECKDGEPTEKLCPDGLLFNPAAGVFAYPCQYPIDVDCLGRSGLQTPQPTEDCPHQFGYFKIGDEVSCGQFMNCADGRGYMFDCPEGLAFNQATYQCDWPDQVEDCNAEAYLGFSCPPEPDQFLTGLGQSEFRTFRSPTGDCQRYFICINGRPRMYNCGVGKAFNDLTNSCDGAENVTGCAEFAVKRAEFDVRDGSKGRGGTAQNLFG